MRTQCKFSAGLWLAAVASLAFPILTSAQAPQIAPRITQAIDETKLTTLRGNTHPLARPQYDQGAAPSSMPLRRMLLVLQRSSQQESALETLLEQQLDASSPNFHQWLTPQQFGQQFGPADQDIQTITSWLQSHGFEVAGVSNGRTVIEFSGTVGQVQEAFHTTIHQYSVNGVSRWANSTDPQIPTALASVVAGINTLYNFPRQPMHENLVASAGAKIAAAGKLVAPQFTFPNPCSLNTQPFCNFAVAPADLAKIYTIPNLLLSPAPPTVYNGDNVTIAIVGQSDIDTNDVTQFRSMFGLPAPKLNVITSGPDPGTVAGVETEADLDVEWAGAVAPNATIDLVLAEETEVSLGADLAAQYAVDNNLAPVLSESFGVCEFFMGTAGNQFYNQLWQQASAQGVSVFTSTGDAGSAVCDGNAGTQGPAQLGLSVSGISSTPYNVAVGGTDFNDINNPFTFWSSSNNATTFESALGYIPELTWNDSCTNQELFSLVGTTTAEQTCNNAQVEEAGFVNIGGGSGGKSGCTTSNFSPPLFGSGNLSSCSGGYAKPAWQTALTPADSVRDVPDVSLFASNGFNGSFYVICEADIPADESIGQCGTGANPSQLVGLGGTSASTPSFAGIMALINQAKGRQGNPNYILYKLAGQAGNTCVSAANPAATCVFYDIPSGSTIAMPCAQGSPNCTISTAGDTVGVLSGYSTTSGYDLATGLGSVNAENLISKWANFALTASNTTLTLNNGTAVNITHGQSVPVTISVSGNGGTPMGNVSLIADTAPPSAPAEVTQQGVQGFTLSSGSIKSSTNVLPGGTYNVFANYAGDGTFASSVSPTQSVIVSPEASIVQIDYQTFNPTTGQISNQNATSVTFGTPAQLRVNVTSQAGDACATNSPGNSGCPTGNITITDSYNGGASTPLDGGTFALNIQGYAEDQAIALPGGTHKISVTYNGDNSYNAPATNPTTETITIAPDPTNTGITDISGNNITLGSSISFFADVMAQNDYSSVTPSGSLNFFTGTTPLGSAPLQVCGANAPGVVTVCASFSTTSLPHGLNPITATYNGDANYAGSTSSQADITVLYATNTTVASSNSSVPRGTSVTFTAQVTTGQAGAPAITGTVEFLSDGVPISSGVTLSNNGQAQFTTSSLAGGTHTIGAQYSGDTNFASSTGTTTQTVLLIGTTTSVSSSSSTITQGSNVTFTATVTPAQNGGPTMTGTVQFESNGSNIGSPVNVSNGQAQFQTTTLPVGSDQIIAVYSGDSNYSGSTSGAITETVNATPSFTITANPTTINVSAPGGSGSTVFTFTGQNGFSSGGSVMISANVTGLPSESSCGFASGTSVSIPANGSAMATLNCTTTAPSSLAPASRNRLGVFGPRTAVWTLAFACVVALVIIALGQQKARLRWAGLAGFAVFLTVASASCGGGNGGGGGGGGGGNQGTLPNNYPLTVSVTINGVTENVNIMLDVQ